MYEKDGSIFCSAKYARNCCTQIVGTVFLSKLFPSNTVTSGSSICEPDAFRFWKAVHSEIGAKKHSLTVFVTNSSLQSAGMYEYYALGESRRILL